MTIGNGMNQEVPFEQCQFEMEHLKKYDLFKSFKTYHPIIINVNYVSDGKQYAFMTYGEFTKDSKNVINGVKVTQQLILID